MEIAASAVTFGTVFAQLAVVTVKIKRMWDDVAGIPERIQELLADIEHIRLLFAEMETSVHDPAYPNLPSSFWTGPLMQHSLHRAKRALVELDTVAESLSVRLKAERSALKRKMVAVRGFMDKGKIEKLELRLTRTVDLLWKSYDIASRRLLAGTLQRQLSQTITTEIAHKVSVTNGSFHTEQSIEILNHSSKTDTLALEDTEPRGSLTMNNSGRPNDQEVKVFNPSNAQKRTLLSWRFPLWWSRVVWELCSTPQPGWNYGLRVYNIVPEKSAIIQSVFKQDTAAVVRLFRSKEASPFDRDEENRSLLYHATDRMNPSLDLCKVLLQWGLCDAIHEPYRGGSPLFFASIPVIRSPYRTREDRDVFELLWSHYPDHDYLASDLLPWDFGTFYEPLDESLPSYHDLSLPYRASVIRNEVFFGSNHLDSVWVAKDGTVLATHISESADYGVSLVHSAAINTGRVIILSQWPFEDGPSRHAMPESTAPNEFSQAIIAAATSKDLHHLETVMPPEGSERELWGGTPLISVIGGALYGLLDDLIFFSPRKESIRTYLRVIRQMKVLQEAVYAWAHNLRAGGVDLLAYGQKEQSILQTSMDSFRGSFDADSGFPRNWVPVWYSIASYAVRNTLIPIRLLDLEVGAEPEHWRLVWVFEFEAVAREFWDIIEQPLVLMPGSWLE